MVQTQAGPGRAKAPCRAACRGSSAKPGVRTCRIFFKFIGKKNAFEASRWPSWQQRCPAGRLATSPCGAAVRGDSAVTFTACRRSGPRRVQHHALGSRQPHRPARAPPPLTALTALAITALRSLVCEVRVDSPGKALFFVVFFI